MTAPAVEPSARGKQGQGGPSRQSGDISPLAWYAQPRAVYSGGNEVQLLRGGDALFPAMCEAIAAAMHEVWLATYIFDDDPSARCVVAELVAAAERGVRVRVVVDGFGSQRALAPLRELLEPHGVSLAVFRPLRGWWSWLQPGQLRRLHQKLCVVDGQIGFVGGINLIDDRRDLRHGESERARLDYAVRLTGPVVVPIEHTVRAVWTRVAFGRDWRDEVRQIAHSGQPVLRARAGCCAACASRCAGARPPKAGRGSWRPCAPPSSCATTCASAAASSAATSRRCAARASASTW